MINNKAVVQNRDSVYRRSHEEFNSQTRIKIILVVVDDLENTSFNREGKERPSKRRLPNLSLACTLSTL